MNSAPKFKSIPVVSRSGSLGLITPWKSNTEISNKTIWSGIPMNECHESKSTFSPEEHKLPYLALMAAHLLNSLGESRKGAERLADWIDWSASFPIPEWYRMQALLHLSIIVKGEGDSLLEYYVLYRHVEGLKRVFGVSSNLVLRRWDLWKENCSEHRKETSELYIDDEATRLYLDRLQFLFMNQTDSLVMAAIRAGREEASLLNYARRNTEISENCYIHLLVPGSLKEYKASFLKAHGALLVALASKGFFRSGNGGEDLGAYLDARAYLLRALELLRPVAEEEHQKRRERGSVGESLQTEGAPNEVDEIKRYLKTAERALGLR